MIVAGDSLVKLSSPRLTVAPLHSDDRSDTGETGEDVREGMLGRSRDDGVVELAILLLPTSRPNLTAAAGGDSRSPPQGLGTPPVIHRRLAAGGSTSTYRNGCSASDRSPNAATSTSRSAQIRDTSDSLMPVSASTLFDRVLDLGPSGRGSSDPGPPGRRLGVPRTTAGYRDAAAAFTSPVKLPAATSSDR